MLTFEMIIVFLGLIGMVTALVLDKMRPGMILFSVTVLFLCFGILTPKEMLEGFSNKGMITVALLFLISEGVRQSGALGQLIKKLLPQEKTTVMCLNKSNAFTAYVWSPDAMAYSDMAMAANDSEKI